MSWGMPLQQHSQLAWEQELSRRTIVMSHNRCSHMLPYAPVCSRIMWHCGLFPCTSPRPEREQSVVVMDGVGDGARRNALRLGLRVYAFAEVEGIGAAHKHPHRPPAATDVATFC